MGLIAAIALFGVLAHLAFLVALPARWRVNQSTNYYKFYEPVARNILLGNGLVAPDGSPALEFAPGFSFLLAGAFEAADLLGVSDAFMLRFQVAISIALTTVLVYLIAEHIFWLVDWPRGRASLVDLPSPSLVEQTARQRTGIYRLAPAGRVSCGDQKQHSSAGSRKMSIQAAWIE
jgi:hypothetical protein